MHAHKHIGVSHLMNNSKNKANEQLVTAVFIKKLKQFVCSVFQPIELYIIL